MNEALRSTAISLFRLVLVASAVAACQGAGETNNPAIGNGPGGGTPDGGPGSNVIDAGTFTISSTRNAFQTKSAAQLASTLINCLGPTAGNVEASMLIGQPGGFLSPDSFVPTTTHGVDDVVTQQKKRFDGDPQALASGVRNDELTLEYVTGQRNVGNVAGKRCSSATPPPNCACATLPEATALITRCVPDLLPTDPKVQAAAQTLASACAADRGKAIASFIASTAFAKVP